MDAESVTRGTISSRSWAGFTWTGADTADYMVVDCPIKWGQWGCGLFHATTHELLGVVNIGPGFWNRGDRTENTSFAVGTRVLSEMMLAVQYEARQSPWPVAFNEYHLYSISKRNVTP